MNYRVENGIRKWFTGSMTALLLASLAACGGGGSDNGSGGNGGSGGSGGGIQPLPEALTFIEPDSFSNGREYETGWSLVSFRGGFQSAFTASLDCSNPANSAATPYLEVRWHNLANNESGTATSGIGCVDNGFGMVVTATRWWAEYVPLELGANVFEFDIIENNQVKGRNRVTVYRKDGTPPSVSFVSPGPDSADAPVNAPVFVLFNKAMNQSSLSAERFSVTTADGADVAGSRSYDSGSHAWRFTPASPLIPGVTYVAKVGKGVSNLYRGVLEEDVVWQFTAANDSDAAAPEVVSTWPAGACPCAPSTTRIMLQADEALDPASTMSLADSQQIPVSGEVLYHGKVLEFVPANSLNPNETYTVTVNPLQDLLGNASSESTSWQFGTDDGLVQGSWQELSPPPDSLSGTVMASDDTSVFIFGNATTGFQGYAYQDASDQWQQLAELLPTFATTPEPRLSPSIVWTGSELLVYGGFDSQSRPMDDGGAYQPANDTWRELSGHWWRNGGTSRPELMGLGGHSALWTGNSMLLWGGEYERSHDPLTNRGWIYTPANSWDITGPEPTLDENYYLLPDGSAPAPRKGHAAVWTGTEMLAWGGVDAAGAALGDGGRYDPAADSWQPLSSLGAPSAAPLGAAIWTGTEMLAWNGGQDAAPAIAGEPMRQVHMRAYAPLTDAWRMPESGWEPAFRPDTRFFLFASGAGAVAIGLDADSGSPPTVRTLAVYLYDFASTRWATGAKLPVPICDLSAATLHMGEVYASCSGRIYRYSPW